MFILGKKRICSSSCVLCLYACIWCDMLLLFLHHHNNAGPGLSFQLTNHGGKKKNHFACIKPQNKELGLLLPRFKLLVLVCYWLYLKAFAVFLGNANWMLRLCHLSVAMFILVQQLWWHKTQHQHKDIRS